MVIWVVSTVDAIVVLLALECQLMACVKDVMKTGVMTN